MVDIEHSFERGDKIRVVYEEVRRPPSGGEEIEEREDVGTIISKPSRKFDWENDEFDFDYELERGNAVRSIDIDNELVAQLMYEGGGDRDWDQWNLVKIERVA